MVVLAPGRRSHICTVGSPGDALETPKGGNIFVSLKKKNIFINIYDIFSLWFLSLEILDLKVRFPQFVKPLNAYYHNLIFTMEEQVRRLIESHWKRRLWPPLSSSNTSAHTEHFNCQQCAQM